MATFYRGVDYSPTWTNWAQNPGATQTNDSDFANDAFASLWASKYQAAPAGDASQPIDNTGIAGTAYRDDIGTMHTDGFNLVRLYNWGMNRGTALAPSPYPPDGPALPNTSNVGLDHINFLNYASNQKVSVVAPVSNYYLGNGWGDNTYYSWGGFTPDSNYSFGSAPVTIQDSFKQFISSITDPTTKKIHTAIQSIDVGNEADLWGVSDGTSAAQMIARTNWWIYNLHQQINGSTAIGPDGQSVVNGSTGAIIPITATFSNGDQGASKGGWWADLISGVSTSTVIPNGYWQPAGGTNTFTAAVKGLSVIDASWNTYYYNSLNIQQNGTGIANLLSTYDASKPAQGQGPGPLSAWPYYTFNGVPLVFMEVGPPSVTQVDPSYSMNQAQAIESYLSAHPTTNLIGYNYFEFSNEPALVKANGLYADSAVQPSAQTGFTSTYFTGGLPSIYFPVETLTATPGTGTSYSTLWQAWVGQFGATQVGTAGNDTLVGTDAANSFQSLAGNDKIDGLPGFDTAIYGGNARGYALKATAGSATITIQDKIGTDGTDTLTSIENVRFADGGLPTTWQMATASLPASQVLKVVDLYTAGLNRAPDAVGLDYWASQLANGVSLKDISKAIFSSAEAAPIYSSGNSDAVFVNLSYQAALGRAPDAAGAAYWLNELSTGHIQRTDFVTALIAGARGPGGSAADAQYIANKEAVGAHFALTAGLNNPTWAKAVEAGVNGTAASVTAANAQTDAFAVTAATPATSELVVQIVGLVP